MKHVRIFAGILLFTLFATSISCNAPITDAPIPTQEEDPGPTSGEDPTPNEDPAPPTNEEEPTTSEDGTITTGTLEESGLESQVITDLVANIESGSYPNRHSLLIYKDDKLVLEEYFAGEDENWGIDLGLVQHDATVLHDMRSVSKSVVSACIGIAMSQGLINGIDQPIFDFFEDYNQYNNQGREAITIRHLLTMSSGLRWNENVPYNNPDNSEIQMINSDDGIGFVLSRDMVTAPGAAWRYNGGGTEVLAEIVSRVSGKDIHEYAREFLFAPLGITNSEWTITPATNSPAGASGLRLTAQAMLKFGILYQNEGRWGDAQIVPQAWVNESLSSSINRPGGGGYGYQFWVYNYSLNGKNLTIPAAVGNGDQRIYFDRTNNLVVVSTAGNYNLWNIPNDATAVLRQIYTAFDFAPTN